MAKKRTRDIITILVLLALIDSLLKLSVEVAQKPTGAAVPASTVVLGGGAG